MGKVAPIAAACWVLATPTYRVDGQWVARALGKLERDAGPVHALACGEAHDVSGLIARWLAAAGDMVVVPKFAGQRLSFATSSDQYFPARCNLPPSPTRRLQHAPHY